MEKVRFFDQPYLIYVYDIAKIFKSIYNVHTHILRHTSKGDIAIVINWHKYDGS